MAIGAHGDIVSFALSGVTTYGVVIGVIDATSNDVAYDFGLSSGPALKWAKEYTTTSVTVLDAHI